MTGIYFSGTGNTKFCLSQFLNKICNNYLMYSIENKSSVSAISEDKDILFAYPIFRELSVILLNRIIHCGTERIFILSQLWGCSAVMVLVYLHDVSKNMEQMLSAVYT